MNKAEHRKRELERVREVTILKQVEAEKELFGEKPQFITPKYKQHLLERKKWEEEQAKKDALEEDVTKKGDLSAFYYSQFNRTFEEDAPQFEPPKATAAAQPQSQKEAPTPQEHKAQEPKTEESKDVNKTDTEEKLTGAKRKTVDEPDAPVLTREEKIAQAKLRLEERKRKKTQF